MEKNYKKLLDLISIEPRVKLADIIIAKISKNEQVKVRRKVWTFGTGSLAALGLVLAVGSHLHTALVESGFYQYFSLLFSGDWSFTFWKEIAFSILESTPIFGVITLMIAFIIFVWSTSNTLRPTFNI